MHYDYTWPALPHIGIGNVRILMNVVGLTYNYTGLWLFYNPLSGIMGVAQNTGTGRYCDDTAGYRYRQKSVTGTSLITRTQLMIIMSRLADMICNSNYNYTWHLRQCIFICKYDETLTLQTINIY